MSNIITIDGPASSGKSTAGFLFAQRIGYQFIDSGLIYRIAALIAKRQNIPIDDPKLCAEALQKVDLKFRTEDNTVKLYIYNENVTNLLKTPEIDQLVPIVAAHHEVREATKDIQRGLGMQQDTVIAGRDIGSEIFPEAKLKFFITASVHARAKRRYDQQVKTHPQIKLVEIEEEIRQRDLMDSTREASPMRIPEDAIVIDTSDLTLEQVVKQLYSVYSGRQTQS